MTQEQLDDLIALSAPLLDVPLPWNQLSPEQQTAFKALMPSDREGFTDTQRYWIDKWWLPATQQQIGDINAAVVGLGTYTGREDGEGNLYLSCDILSDAIDGRRLAAALHILETLPLTYKGEEEWPVISAEL